MGRGFGTPHMRLKLVSTVPRVEMTVHSRRPKLVGYLPRLRGELLRGDLLLAAVLLVLRRELCQRVLLPLLDVLDHRVYVQVDLRLGVALHLARPRHDEDAAKNRHCGEKPEIRQPRRIHRTVVREEPADGAPPPPEEILEHAGIIPQKSPSTRRFRPGTRQASQARRRRRTAQRE